MGTDATQSAKGLYQALSAGVPRENSIEFLATASELAIAGVTDVSTAVDGLTNTINAFKIPIEEADMVADKLFTTVVNGKTTLAELSQNMSKASVPAAALGVDLDELLAVVIGLTKQGVPVSEAFTQVKAVMSALQNPSEELAAVYEQMEVGSARAAVAQYGFVGSLEQVRQRLAGNDLALFNASRGMEGYNGILSVTGENLKTVDEGLRALEESNGSSAKASAQNAATLENSINSLKAAAISLVETMEGSLGVISFFTQGLKDSAWAINEIMGNNISHEANFLIQNTEQSFEYLTKVGDRINALKAVTKSTEAEMARSQNGFDTMGMGWANNKALKEIEALEKAYSKVNVELRYQYEAKAKIAETRLQEQAGVIVAGETARISKIENDNLIQKLILQRESIEQSAIAAQKKAEEQARTKAAGDELNRQSKLEKEAAKEKEAEAKRAAKEADSRLKRQIEQAKDAATTQREKLELEIKGYEALRNSGQISDEIFNKAKRNLEEEIILLDKRNEKKALKAGRVRMEKGVASLPQINNPFAPRNEYDYLREQEDQVIASYEKRKEAILRLTSITEDEKIALIEEANAQVQDIMIRADIERNNISLGYAAEFFGNLSTMANSFGERGAKVAKAAAIAETIINTYKSATAAYAAMAPIPYVGPVLGAAAAGAAIASGFANVQAIRSQPVNVARYEQGGIVGGNSFSGDNVQARVNSGEMILNRGQQKNLFDIANGGGGANGTVVNVVVRPTPGQTADVKQNPNDPQQMEIILRRVDEKLNSDLQTGSGKFVPALTKRIPDLKKPL
jgi:TP901 family phage tail tape measure protein